MVQATAYMMNTEMEGYNSEDEINERYNELCTLYKEYVKFGEKVKHRRHAKQAYAVEIRTKFGKDITVADVSTLLTKLLTK